MEAIHEMMTVEEVARYLRIQESTVLDKVRHKEIPFTRVGKRILFPRSGLRLWIVENTEGPATFLKHWRSIQLEDPKRLLAHGDLTPDERRQLAASKKAVKSSRLVNFDL